MNHYNEKIYGKGREEKKCFKAIKNEVGRSQQKVIKLKVKEAIPNIDQSIDEMIVGPDDQRKREENGQRERTIKMDQ